MNRSRLLLVLLMIVLLTSSYGLTQLQAASLPQGAEPIRFQHLAEEPGEFLTGPNQGKPLDIALAYIAEVRGKYGLSAADIADLVVTDQYQTEHNGTTHIYLRQRYQGIEIYGANVSIHIARDGSVIALGSQMLPNLSAASKAIPALTARDAVAAAARGLNLSLTEELVVRENLGGTAQAMVFEGGNLSLDAIPVKLMYHANEKGELKLAWDLSIYELSAEHYWSVRVDAATGAILGKDDWVIHEEWGHSDADAEHAAAEEKVTESKAAIVEDAPFAPDHYRVYAAPVESPSHGSRSLVANPAHSVASPYGWHDTNGATGAESTFTVGNNVDAYEDSNNSNSPTGGNAARADGGATLTFDHPLDLTQAPSTYRPAAITNLFYWNNLIHDVWYQYGFNEASGNFQANNYGRGGSANDSVQAEAQDGGGTNNANFATPPDGSRPRMQMYIWTAPNPDRDGDFDNGIIVHEYGHGISIRLTGGPANSSCLNNQEQGGEGWSDWFGLMMTMKAGDTGPQRRGVGTYALNQPIDGVGIRPAPYSTDMSINNYTYANITTLAVPHGVGFAWATMLWEMNWALVNHYGFDPNLYSGTGGNNIAMRLVIDGLKLQPCSPGFVDARNAILQADQNNNGGVNQCRIWTAFAKRGLGYSANQGSSGSRSDGTQAFDLPPACSGGPTPTPAPSTPTPTTVPPTVTPTVPAGCVLYTSTDVPKAISASGTPSVASLLNIAGSGTIADVNVVNLNGTHTYFNDLDFTLRSPAGTNVQIMARTCSSQDNFALTLDDEAAGTPGGWPCPPVGGGSYRPSNALSGFDGQSANGTWTLTVRDNANLDGGSLNGWGLLVCAGGPAPTATPVPPTPTPPPPTATPPSPTCTTYTSTDVPKAISASGTPSVSSILSVPTAGTITDINVLGLTGNHTYINDLDFTLRSPAGTNVQIMARSCSSQDNFNLNLDDEAAGTPGGWPCPPVGGGTYRPSNALSGFDGQNRLGTWTLTVRDNANLDGGSLTGWRLQICTQ